MPHVAVILPVYNAAPFLADAVRSILNQTHRDLQLLVLNDGSTDDSPAILTQLTREDPRLHVSHQSNAGAVTALNRLIDRALQTPAEFLALMHADDISLPTRLQKQLEHFSAHPETAILGTDIQSFLTPAATVTGLTATPIQNQRLGEGKIENPTPRVWHYPPDPRFTKPSLLFWCCFAHPTMMFRRHVLAGSPTAPPLRYDPDAPMPCEDYALWAAAAQHHALANVPEILLHYRLHAAQSGSLLQQRAAPLTLKIRRSLLLALGIDPTAAELALHQSLAESAFSAAPDLLPATRAWLEKLRAANTRTSTYDAEAFARILAARWAATCLYAAAHNLPDVWRQFWSCPLAPYVDRSLEKNHAIPASPSAC